MVSALNIFPQTISYLISDEAVYRTAPATPGLLIRFQSHDLVLSHDDVTKGVYFPKGLSSHRQGGSVITTY